MSGRNRMAMIIAIAAGILLVIAGVSGAAKWETIKTFVTAHVIDDIAVQIFFGILIFIASLGGISVIIGGVLIGKNRVRTGKFIISLGAGIGLIGLIISIMMSVMENSLVIGEFMSTSGTGLILSIVAGVVAK